MSEFGTHEPQPNEGNGDANNHTSKTLSKSLDHAMPVRTHTVTESTPHTAANMSVWAQQRDHMHSALRHELPPRPLPEVQA